MADPESRDIQNRGERAREGGERGGGGRLRPLENRAFDDVFGRSLAPLGLFDLWRQAFSGLPAMGAGLPGSMGAGLSGSMGGLASTDIHETDKEYRLTVELPGLKPEDVEVSLEGDALRISGEKSQETEATRGAYRVSERRFGRFERSFPLPADVDAERIQAEVRDGLLRVTLPKRADATQGRRRIDVRGAGQPGARK
jgi:HSP20 family protein